MGETAVHIMIKVHTHTVHTTTGGGARIHISRDWTIYVPRDYTFLNKCTIRFKVVQVLLYRKAPKKVKKA